MGLIFICTFFVIFCGIQAIPFNLYDDESYKSDSSEQKCLINETILEIMFTNLRKLMYSGDHEHAIPPLAPFIIDEPVNKNFSKMSVLKRLQLNGYDKFIVEEANVNSKCTSINFTLNIPFIYMKAQEIDLLGNVFFINVNEKNTTIDGYIEMESDNNNECIVFNNIDIAWNYDDVEVSVASDAYKSVSAQTVAKDLAKSLIKALKPFDLENKAKTVESTARRVFKRLGCWKFSVDTLLVSNDRT
uniref:CSON011363 protein n=1 Tax=Culicoides sonorensis TaxID=179676 RepID=A0A336M5Y9_CULSO